MATLPLLYGSLTVSVIKATGLKNTDNWLQGVSDPYTQVYLDDYSIARTKTIMDNLNPVWGASESYTRSFTKISFLTP